MNIFLILVLKWSDNMSSFALQTTELYIAYKISYIASHEYLVFAKYATYSYGIYVPENTWLGQL